jgi:hypothetical protein
MSDENRNDVTAEDALKAQLEALRAENETLKATRTTAPPRKLTCKPAKSGGMSVYGLGRWPVTLYGSQWKFFLDNVQTVRDHLNAFSAAGILKEKDRE